MATILQVNPGVARGAEVLGAISQIQAGLATLQRLDGLRAEAIAVNGTEVQAVFGVQGADTGSAFNDRWVALVSLLTVDVGQAAQDHVTPARDFLNAVTQQYS